MPGPKEGCLEKARLAADPERAVLSMASRGKHRLIKEQLLSEIVPKPVNKGALTTGTRWDILRTMHHMSKIGHNDTHAVNFYFNLNHSCIVLSPHSHC